MRILWALERTAAFKGRYHVLGGVLSALDGIGPEQLNLGSLFRRIEAGGVKEVVLALGATVDGQTTAHFLSDRLQPFGVAVSRLAHGVPVGGELDYLDDGTIASGSRCRGSLPFDCQGARLDEAVRYAEPMSALLMRTVARQRDAELSSTRPLVGGRLR